MKGEWVKKLLENKKIVRIGCGIMAAVVLASGGFYVYETQNTYMPELGVFIDGEEVVISDEEVPLASAPKVTKKTKTKKKTKTVKLKKASKKSYTKKLPTKTTTKTTTRNTSTQTIVTKVETTVSVTEKYTKKKKTKKVTTTTKTVTTTTTTTKEKTSASKTATKGVTAADEGGLIAEEDNVVIKKALDVNVAAVKADANLRNAYTSLGFTVAVDSTVNYSGKFDARSRTITLKADDDDIYHEIGHFLTFLAGVNVKAGGNGYKVYAAEKDLYTGVNKAYVCQNADEYLAEAYRDYCLNPAALQASRPLTYQSIVDALAKVTDAQVAKYKRVYASIWK